MHHRQHRHQPAPRRQAHARKGSLAALRGLLPFLAPYRRQFVLAGDRPAGGRRRHAGHPVRLQADDRPRLRRRRRRAGHRATSTPPSSRCSAWPACWRWRPRRASTWCPGWASASPPTSAAPSTATWSTQSPEFFETTQTGEVLSRLTTDTTLIQTVVGTSISLALRNTLLFVGGLAMLFVTSAKLTSIILGLLVLVVRADRAVRPPRAHAVARLAGPHRRRLGAWPARSSTPCRPCRPSRTRSSEARPLRRLGRRRLPHRDAAHPRARLLTMLAIVLVFGAIVFVLWLGAHAVLAGTMTGGDLGQFILYASIVAGAIGALSEVMGEAQRAAGATERLLELLARAAPPSRTRRTPQPLPPRAAGGAALRLDDVSFSYPSRPGQRGAVAPVACDIQPGETVAIVGPSGAGKTTLFQLLLRFYDPQSGAIRLDGVDIRELDLHTLRGAIGIVPQDTVIFSANAMENIRYGRARRQRRRSDRRGEAGRRPRIHRAPAGGLRLLPRRARRAPVRRPAPAHRDRPRPAEEPAAAAARRSHQRARRRIRAPGAARAGSGDGRPHHRSSSRTAWRPCSAPTASS